MQMQDDPPMSPSEALADPIQWLLRISVCSAKELPKMDLIGKCDAFVEVTFGQKKFVTRTIKKSYTPVWEQDFWVLVRKSETRYDIRFDVYDWDIGKNDYVGKVDPIDIEQLPANGEPFLRESTIWGSKRGKKVNNGQLMVEARLYGKQSVELDFWKELIAHFDTDGTGEIAEAELIGLLSGVGSSIDLTDVSAVFQAIDTDRSTTISSDELIQFMNSPDPRAAQFFPHDPELIWNVTVYVKKMGGSIGEAVMHGWAVPDSSDHGGDAFKGEIAVFDRATGQVVMEKIPNYIKIAMKVMYKSKAGKALTGKDRVQKILKSLTVKQGKKYDDPKSVEEIEHFSEFHGLNMEEVLDPIDSFKCFNEFFYRKLKPEARPIASPQDHKHAVSPADCRLNVFPTVTDAKTIWIKGKSFSLPELLGTGPEADAAAQLFSQGTMIIARLAPQDYHRFHSPVSGVIGDFHPIDGTYYTVNPIAVNEKVDVYTENKRSWFLIDSAEFGSVLMVAVGATMVGSINFTVSSGAHVNKGDELGYFAFGGSTTLVFFRPGTILLDQDLVLNSQKPLETLVKVGESLGRSTA